MIVALDPGFGNTKVSTAANCAVIQSAVARPINIGRAGIGLRTASARSTKIEIENSGSFVVGSGSWSWGDPLSSMDYSSLTSAARLALFYAGLAECLPAGEHVIDRLTVGLPVPLLQNESDADETIKQLRTLKRDHIFYRSDAGSKSDPERYSISIGNITVLAQPVGAYADYLISDDLKINKDLKDAEIAVIDLGMNTLDLYVVKSGKIEPRFIAGAKVGVRRFIELAQEYDHHDLVEIDELIRTGNIKLSDPYLTAAFDSWFQSVNAEIEKVFKNLARFSAIVTAGGGCSILNPILVPALARRGAAVYVPTDPISVNVRGLYKWSAYMYR